MQIPTRCRLIVSEYQNSFVMEKDGGWKRNNKCNSSQNTYWKGLRLRITIRPATNLRDMYGEFPRIIRWKQRIRFSTTVRKNHQVRQVAKLTLEHKFQKCSQGHKCVEYPAVHSNKSFQ